MRSLHRSIADTKLLSRVVAGVLVPAFLIAGCHWAPNQSSAVSDLTLQVEHGALREAGELSGEPRRTLTGALGGDLLSLPISRNSLGALQEEEIGEDTELDFDFDFLDPQYDSESILLVYYVEREALATNGIEEVDVGTLINDYFEQNFGEDLFLAFEEFDPEDFEQALFEIEQELYEEFGLRSEEDFEELTEEELYEFLYAFFVAIFEIFLTPFVSLFEFLQDIFTTGIQFRDTLPGETGGYVINVRGGSIASSGTSTSLTLRNLRPDTEYVTIVGYYEVPLDGEEPAFEVFGFGSVMLTEGLTRSVRIQLSNSREQVETNLNEFLGTDPGFVNLENLVFEFDDYFEEFEVGLF